GIPLGHRSRSYRHLLIMNPDPSSWKGGNCDPTVRLQSGAHPFISRDSYVVYNFAEVERCITIEAGVTQGRFVRREPFQGPDLSRIINGISKSRFTPKKVKKYLASLH
ncbi:hypothetical protein PVW47_05265, partial [Marinovum sp. SP66]|uniref:hypothetical protein n=1 Tax=Marinovum sp. SP66 TaxID=3028379 RepID=UPI00237BCED3